MKTEISNKNRNKSETEELRKKLDELEKIDKQREAELSRLRDDRLYLIALSED